MNNNKWFRLGIEVERLSSHYLHVQEDGEGREKYIGTKALEELTIIKKLECTDENYDKIVKIVKKYKFYSEMADCGFIIL